MNLMKLSLSGDTFSAFKTDFDNVLQVTLNKMLENNESEGVLTAKVTVHLSDEVTDDGLEIRRPLIAHDIKSVVQAKSAVSGLLTGNYALKWDKDTLGYVLVDADQAQTSLYDES